MWLTWVGSAFLLLGAALMLLGIRSIGAMEGSAELLQCIGCSSYSVAYALFIWKDLQQGDTEGVVLMTLLLVIFLSMANYWWNRYNRRKRKRPKRATGKVRVRLSRLVIVPMGVQ